MPRHSGQFEMKLRSVPRWGGRRENAGRKPNADSGIPHTSREDFSSTLPAHVTVRLLPDLQSLRNRQVVRALERTFAVASERSFFRLVHYSLLGNHAHFIVEARSWEALGRGMMAIGSRLALAVKRGLRYVLLNASVSRLAAWAIRPLLDAASSSRWFDGWKRMLSPEAFEAPAMLMKEPAVARARTWLLRVGWRRHGLLDPAEVLG